MAKAQVQGNVSAWVAGAVCSAMFVGIKAAQQFEVLDGWWGWLGGLFGSALLGYWFYRLLLAALMQLFMMIALVRRLVLGKAYLEGTWIGHFTRSEGPLLSIEVIDQEGDHLQITGRAIGRDGRMRMRWYSTSTAFDLQKKQLHYSYECISFDGADSYTGDGTPKGGLGIFQVHYSGGNANRLAGHAIDIGNGTPDQNDELRIGGKSMTDEKIFELARKHFPAQFGSDWPRP